MILIAGIGNVFFRDDGFGAEVVQRLAANPPPNTRVIDYGIRAIHLAYELLSPYELCIVADCMSRGGPPGTLYVVEPDLELSAADADPHTMTLPTVAATIRQLGGSLPPMVVVGCEPADLEPGLGLSPIICAVIPAAVALLRDVVAARQPQQELAP